MLARLRPSGVQLQGAGYAASQALIVLLAGLSTLVVARALSTQAFGAQSFVVSFLTFTALLFDFGLFLPAARLAAQSTGLPRETMVGAALLVFVPVGLFFCGTVFVLSFFVNTWFHVDAGHTLRLVSAVTFVYPLAFVANYLAQGVDRLHVYSVTTAAGQALYLLFVLAAPLLHVELTFSVVLELRLAALLTSAIIFVVWLSPKFRGALARLPELLRDTRAYGFQTYVGRVLSVATYNMDVIMLGALTNATAVGYYTLAGSAAYVVGLPVYGLCAALFSRMTSASAIEGRWLAFAWVSGLACALAVSAIAPVLIPLLLSKRYAGAIALIPPLALAEAVRGVTTVYNTFLAAQGNGRALRKAAIILTSSNVVFNFVLIPPFGAFGAAWASLAALVANLVAHIVVYRRSLGARALAHAV
jgi:O-antigen/teichoic acid export membrane protein